MIKKLLILVLVIGYLNPIIGQSETNNELWVGYSAKFKFNQKWQLGLKTQQRYNDNFAELKLNYLATNLGYKISKNFGLKADFRHTWRPQERNVKRYTIDFLAKRKIKKYKFKFKLDYRARILLNRAYYTGESSSYFRNKIGIQSKINKKITPYLNYELFYEIKDNDENMIHTHRYTGGLTYTLKKNTILKTYLRFDQEVNKENPDKQRILGFVLIQSF